MLKPFFFFLLRLFRFNYSSGPGSPYCFGWFRGFMAGNRHAYSPEAKGRIERVWRTCQNRLVSELRLAQATTLPQANAALKRFCSDYNRRFARPVTDAACDFRVLPRRFQLARCLSLQYQRVVGADHVVRLGRTRHCAATVICSSWLRRRNRRNLPSIRWHAACLSRRPAAPHANPTSRRTS